jgi:hypothetical protein
MPEQLYGDDFSKQKRIEEIVDSLTLFDDDLMSMVFDGNIKATELVLRIILDQEDIKVLSVVGQRELENPLVGGHSIRLDIYAQDSTGREIDIEVQRSNEGAHVRRARFHSSMLDSRMLKARQQFRQLADSYVIFLAEQDILGAHLPVYHIDRTVRELGAPFRDGNHIIYVNGSYHGDDPIGKLVHDFRCKSSAEMFYSELSQGVKHFKETQGGRKDMCRAVEEYGRLCAAEAQAAFEKKQSDMIKNLMVTLNVNLEQAMNILGISEPDRIALRDQCKLS